MILKDFEFSLYKNESDYFFKHDQIKNDQTIIKLFEPTDLSLAHQFIMDNLIKFGVYLSNLSNSINK